MRCMKNRIKQLKQKIREVTGHPKVFASHDASLKDKQAILERVFEFDTSSKRTLMDLLAESGLELPRPNKLSERDVKGKLWEVIHALLTRYVVLGNTDHLTDRELYTLLWNETLRKEYVICPRYTLQIDMTNTGIDGGMRT